MDSINEMNSLLGNKSSYTKSNKYILMHKNIECAEITIEQHNIQKFRIINELHLPPLLKVKFCSRDLVREWLESRVVMPNRDDFDRLKIMILDESYNRLDWTLDNHCLSLSDCYWVRNENEQITWNKINYYTNDFDCSLNDILIDSKIEKTNKYKHLISAGVTVTASLPKTWEIKDGRRLLYKRGQREIYNEVFISEVFKLLNKNCNTDIKFVEYYLDTLYNKKCSVCKCMANENIELITAYDLTYSLKKSNQYVKQYLDYVGVDLKTFEFMCFFDYIFVNSDRHWNNFGVLRNPDTCEIISLAPIYDNGDSLWYDTEIGSSVKFKINNPLQYTNYKEYTFIDELKEIIVYVANNFNEFNDYDSIMRKVASKVCDRIDLLYQR